MSNFTPVVAETMNESTIDAILGGTKIYENRISLFVFQRSVLDLLVNAFDPNALREYTNYCGELTRSLHVTANDDPEKILFKVPPLAVSPITTISDARSGGMTIASMLQYLEVQRERLTDTRGIYEATIGRAVRTPDMMERVVKPLVQLLSMFDRRLRIPTDDGVLLAGPDGLIPEQQLQQNSVAENTPTDDGFYEDDYID